MAQPTQYTFYVVTDEDLLDTGKEQAQKNVKRQIVTHPEWNHARAVKVIPTPCNAEEIVKKVMEGVREFQTKNQSTIEEKMSEIKNLLQAQLSNQGLAQNDKDLLQATLTSLKNADCSKIGQKVDELTAILNKFQPNLETILARLNELPFGTIMSKLDALQNSSEPSDEKADNWSSFAPQVQKIIQEEMKNTNLGQLTTDVQGVNQLLNEMRSGNLGEGLETKLRQIIREENTATSNTQVPQSPNLSEQQYEAIVKKVYDIQAAQFTKQVSTEINALIEREIQSGLRNIQKAINGNVNQAELEAIKKNQTSILNALAVLSIPPLQSKEVSQLSKQIDALSQEVSNKTEIETLIKDALQGEVKVDLGEVNGALTRTNDRIDGLGENILTLTELLKQRQLRQKPNIDEKNVKIFELSNKNRQLEEQLRKLDDIDLRKQNLLDEMKVENNRILKSTLSPTPSSIPSELIPKQRRQVERALQDEIKSKPVLKKVQMSPNPPKQRSLSPLQQLGEKVDQTIKSRGGAIDNITDDGKEWTD